MESMLSEMKNLLNEGEETIYKKRFNKNGACIDEDTRTNHLSIAIQNRLKGVVRFLVEVKQVDVNRVGPNEADRPPAFLACACGDYQILKIILAAEPKPATNFKTRNLLHEVCRNFRIDTSFDPRINFQSCFDLVLDLCNVTEKDELEFVPLHYATRYGNEKAVKSLLKKNKNVGAENIVGKTPVDYMSHEALEFCLDQNISTNVWETVDEKVTVTIDFNFLKAPVTSNGDKLFRTEIALLQIIAKNARLRPLILHPVLSSFVYLKWNNLRHLFFGNLVMYLVFMLSLIIHIVLCQSCNTNQCCNNSVHIISLLTTIVLILQKTFLILAFEKYWRFWICWFEIFLIFFGCMVLISMPEKCERAVRAIFILCSAYEYMVLIGQLPFLSISTNMAMYGRVLLTFLKLMLLYSIPLLAFALCFHTLFSGNHAKEMDEKARNYLPDSGESKSCHDNNNSCTAFQSFQYLGISIIRIIVMFTGELEVSSLNLDRHGVVHYVILLLFIFLVPIVLFNLLNALAVDDIHGIKSEGELFDLCQRIDVLNKYESIIMSQSGFLCRMTSCIIRQVSVFLYKIPDGIITIKVDSSEVFALKPRNISIAINGVQEQELQNFNNNSTTVRTSPGELQKIFSMDPEIMKKIIDTLELKKREALHHPGK